MTKFNKVSKILAIALLAILFFSIVGTTVLAADLEAAAGVNPVYTDTAKVTAIGNKILGVVQVIGYFVAVIMLVWIGIKYVTAAPEGKAELKKSMVIYVIAAVLIIAASTIVGAINGFAMNL